MGSYINLGFIVSSKKNDFIDKCIALIERLDEFHPISIKYPKDEFYTVWTEKAMSEYSIKQAMECCCDYEMAEIFCDLKIGQFHSNEVLLRVKQIQESALCLLFEIPEMNEIFTDIDVAELEIVDLMNRLIDLGFEYAFCDSEADTPENLKQINKDEEYSIFVRYKPYFEVTYASWKINGLFSRK
mgnify:FL=1